jgi:type 1 glutamine amidotransferase
MNRIRFCLLPIALVLALVPEARADKIKVLIVDGQNNHGWEAMTPVNRKTLEHTGLFTVHVSTSPPRKATTEQWAKWRPQFSKYDVLVSNYNGELWPEEVRKDFIEYVKGGGGLVIIHAADNSFPEWKEYNEMIAVGGWGGRNEKDGPYIRFRDGKVVLDNSKGRGGSHGPQRPFHVVARNEDHPIMKGLPKKWLHVKDELYDSLRGPAKNFELLATSYSEKTKEHEPMLLTIRYGKGRIFHTPLGHVSPTDSIKCVGFQTVLVRGTEWAATGQVTTAVPANFPGPDKVSSAEPEEIVWKRIETSAKLKFKAGSCCDKAAKAGKTCGHACCKKAAVAGKVCAMCNPG